MSSLDTNIINILENIVYILIKIVKTYIYYVSKKKNSSYILQIK